MSGIPDYWQRHFHVFDLRGIAVLAVIGLLPVIGVAADFQSEVRPVLERLCIDCHGPETQKADLRLDQLNPDFINGGDADTWHDVLDQINLGDMPPEKAEHQFSRPERILVTDWLNRSLKEVAAIKRNAGGQLASRRLTRYEYANTMRDLLGIEFDFARELPPEPPSVEGFLNNASSLEFSPTQIETYLSVARKALEIAIVDGEMPRIYESTARQTSVGKLPRRKDGGAIPVNPEFVLDIPEFPRSGEFQIVIKAGSIVPEGHHVPRMRVELGCVPGIIHVPRKLVGEVDVTASAEDPATYVFRGRMEDYPQAGRRRFGSNVDFNGVIALINFIDADGNEIRYPHRRYSDPPPRPKKKGAPIPKLPPAPEGPLLDIVIDSISYTAPVIASWPPPSHEALLGEDMADESQRAKQSVTRFLPRAFRRPVSADEIDRFFTLYQSMRLRSESFEAAMRETFAAVLVSPHFLNLVSTDDDFELANRLAYFLWSTSPDRSLVKLAELGKLRNRETLAAEAERMLDDHRSKEFAVRFSDQWFDLDGLDRVAVNPEFFPEFDDDLKEAMRKETHLYFAEILQGDLSCLELIDSNWTVANRALASHYGLKSIPRSAEFERITLDPSDKRGGLLGQGAFLLSNSNGESSHPIKRAVWILDRILDDPPAPPPPDVPDLDTESADLAGLTLKEQLGVHREKEACLSCHENLDPWGVALENFDAIGLYRTEAPVRITKSKIPNKRVALDSTTELPNGTTLSGADDLKQYLLTEKRDHFAGAVTKRLATYALGRSLDLGDRDEIERLTGHFKASGFRLRSLIIELVTSDLFAN